MGAPAGLKLHAELAALLGGSALAALHHLAPVYAAAAPALQHLTGAQSKIQVARAEPGSPRAAVKAQQTCDRLCQSRSILDNVVA